MTGGAFLPPDPRVEEPYRFTPKTAVRIAIFGVLAVCLFAVLFFRLWALQVIAGDRYLADAQDNQIRAVRIQPTRGPILDRDRRPLVTNVPGTVVQLWPAYVPDGQLDDVVRRLSALLDVPRREIRKSIQEHRGDPLTPVIVKTSVHDPKADYLYEHLPEFPGVKVAQTELRHYDDGSLAAQLLGYVGEISPDELERFGPAYAGGDRIGKTGIERAYDGYLRGEPGLGQTTVNAQGDRTGPFATSQLPKAGYAVRLTIDSDLQQSAEQAIRDGIAFAHDKGSWAANGGAVVAMNPKNGEILALASYPTFDPAIYAGRRDPRKLNALGDPRENFPSLNRATDGLYPAGSTFKPVTALAALAEGLITPTELFQCQPQMIVDGQKFTNWNPDINQPMELTTALATSCDTYFYQLGLVFYNQKKSPFQAWAHRMGFGRHSGIDVGPENDGLVPTPAWRRRTFANPVDRLWTSGDSVQLAIGQGDLLVTPLQMARFYALVANGGRLVEPHLVKDIEQPASSRDEAPVVLRSFAAKPPRDIGLNPQWIRVVQEGLYNATHASYGTSYGIFGSYPIPIAGKTGTAEKYVQLPPGYPGVEGGWYRGMQDQSWWCGYGPTPDPSLVVCALIENGGHGGDAAAPAALEVFEEYFHTPAPSVGRVPSD